jgi:phosphoenolpyruvate---glycerone phosphotransferase subunit DhaL
MKSFTKNEGILVLDNVIKVVQKNKQYLSDIDGAIADGDHGVNMNKGFTMCREALDQNPGDIVHGFSTLAKILMMKIGGSMGPLYGKMFKAISTTLAEKENIDAQAFGSALIAMKEAIKSISQAQPGDKTLVDVLFPAVEAYHSSLDSGADFTLALAEMKSAAEAGRDATEDMVAKIGRSARLGERSRGVIDAGAASCALILVTMADTITELISK